MKNISLILLTCVALSGCASFNLPTFRNSKPTSPAHFQGTAPYRGLAEVNVPVNATAKNPITIKPSTIAIASLGWVSIAGGILIIAGILLGIFKYINLILALWTVSAGLVLDFVSTHPFIAISVILLSLGAHWFLHHSEKVGSTVKIWIVNYKVWFAKLFSKKPPIS